MSRTYAAKFSGENAHLMCHVPKRNLSHAIRRRIYEHELAATAPLCIKIYHATRSSARRQIKQMRRDGEDIEYLNAYRCDVCDGWHVGHSIRRDGKIKCHTDQGVMWLHPEKADI